MKRSNGVSGTTVQGRRYVPTVDFYQRVPRDLTEATKLGAIMSLCCISIMSILFMSETIAFAKTKTVTEIFVDDQSSLQPQIKLNFDLSFYALPCEYLSVDVLDSLGTNRQNITKNVEKWHLDDSGKKRDFHGVNVEQREIKHDEDHPNENDAYDWIPGDTPVVLDSEHFETFLQEHPAVFVDFFAPWCIWCQRLHPTWEYFAKDIKDSDLKLVVAMVDCVAQQTLCQQHSIRAFPTLRYFENGRSVTDYHGDRTTSALMVFSQDKMKNMDFNVIQITPRMILEQNHLTQEGCQVSGHIMINRVPGNFHVEARSNSHNLNIAMTNLTHTINHLSFGNKEDFDSARSRRVLKHFPISSRQFNPLEDTTYKTLEYHKAFHHNVKVVSTKYTLGPSDSRAYYVFAHQILAQSQLVEYEIQNVPEARFSYDISPMGVGHSMKARMWYDYVTSLLAIIGGTFSTLGLIDATLYRIFKSKKL